MPFEVFLKEKETFDESLNSYRWLKYSKAAVDSVCLRQWPSGSRFMVLGVAEHLISRLDPMLLSYENEALGDIKTQCEEFVSKSVAVLKDKIKDATVEGAVVEGNAADQIVHKALEWGADFVIMGSHGRGGLEKFLLGSVSEAVVSRVPCSVEIIKLAKVQADSWMAHSIQSKAN